GNPTIGDLDVNVPVDFSVYKNGGSDSSAATIASYTGKYYDNLGLFDLSAGSFVVPKSGVYRSTVSSSATSAHGGTFLLDVDGSNFIQRMGENASTTRKNGTIDLWLNKGQTVKLYSNVNFTPD